jgi:hypothetical protein
VYACEVLDFEAVKAIVEAIEAHKARKAAGTGAGGAAKSNDVVSASSKSNNKTSSGSTGPAGPAVTIKLSPVAVCAHAAVHDPGAGLLIMKLLLAAGADPNVQCDMGLTPLHWASTPGVARVLLAHGADPRIRDTKGRTALEHHRYHSEVDDFCAFDDFYEREPQETDVARVIAAYERNFSGVCTVSNASHASQEANKSRKIKRSDSAGRAGRTGVPDSREEKPKRARTAA